MGEGQGGVDKMKTFWVLPFLSSHRREGHLFKGEPGTETRLHEGFHGADYSFRAGVCTGRGEEAPAGKGTGGGRRLDAKRPQTAPARPSAACVRRRFLL